MTLRGEREKRRGEGRQSVRQCSQEECAVLSVIRLLLLFKPDNVSEQRRFEGRGRTEVGRGDGEGRKNTLEIDHIEHASAEEVKNERGERGGKFRSYFSPSFPLLSLCVHVCVCVAFRPPRRPFHGSDA